MNNIAATNESFLAIPEVRAFLDLIAWAEGGTYNKLYGGDTFSGFTKHPNKAIRAGKYVSTAAGRYQFLYKTWVGIAQKLDLPDFSPHSQDLAAVELIKERGQLQKIAKGDLIGTLKGLGCAWAALPYSGCGQKTRGVQETINYFNAALKVYQGKPITQVVPKNQSSAPQTQKTDNSIYIAAGVVALLLLA